MQQQHPQQARRTPEETSRVGRGRVELVAGPMFSGKSTELLRRLRMQEIAGHACACVTYEGDVRSEQDGTGVCVRTHDGLRCDATPAYRLADADAAVRARHASVVCVDEGQFFPDLVTYCELWAEQGKTVIVAALSGSYAREPFPLVSALAARADAVSFLLAVCASCGAAAPFTRRTGPGRDLQEIGGLESYRAVCRACYANEERQRSPSLPPSS